jgi:hypothetical protein
MLFRGATVALLVILFSGASYARGTSPSIATSATTIAAGGPLVATVRNGPGDPKDWVGLYPVGSAFDYPLGSEWEYMNGKQTLPASGIRNASLAFSAWPTPGQYQFRLYNGNTTALVAETSVITVTPVIPPPPPPPPPPPRASAIVGEARPTEAIANNAMIVLRDITILPS